MYEFSEYLWAIYVFSALCLTVIAWHLFNKIKTGWLADTLILLTTVLLLTPWVAVPGKPDLAPIFIILVTESFLTENPSILRAGLPLAGYLLMACFALWAKRKVCRGVTSR